MTANSIEKSREIPSNKMRNYIRVEVIRAMKNEKQKMKKSCIIVIKIFLFIFALFLKRN